MERTYVMCKPDAVQRGLVGEILKRFEQRGFQLLALELQHPTRERLEEHYGDLKSKPFFPALVEYMLSGPVVAMVFGGINAVKMGRVMVGETNPLASTPGSLRGDFSMVVGRNIVHASDAVESAEKEIALWFPNGVKNYTNPIIQQFVYE
ncbi:nucleoside diphosphate kinase [Hesseltinella vesiculosa]|uniref:Nucleoside diphosphate kinase n=1 Tax=Hesseltinella vesiculosa TaxID=101127 RepID=A0A1X2GGY9_9FUNG|nr:nucleoside diphosphate kinase [Hesseltinella vesiculosa]